MGKRVPLEHKLALLQLIKDKRDILFGKFSNLLDHGMKKAAWEEVLVKARSLEIVPNGKTSNYVRDSVWGVWRARALEKRDNKNKTGTGGGSKNVMNEVDLMILEIVGKDSAVVVGLDIGETGNSVTATVAVAEQEETDNEVNVEKVTAETTPINVNDKQYKKMARKRFMREEENSEKRNLQCELMKIKIYKSRLEALKMEKELGLPPSEFTKTLVPE